MRSNVRPNVCGNDYHDGNDGHDDGNDDDTGDFDGNTDDEADDGDNDDDVAMAVDDVRPNVCVENDSQSV